MLARVRRPEKLEPVVECWLQFLERFDQIF